MDKFFDRLYELIFIFSLILLVVGFIIIAALGPEYVQVYLQGFFLGLLGECP